MENKITIAVTDGVNILTSTGQVFPMVWSDTAYPAALLCEACMRRNIQQLWFAPKTPHFTLDDMLGWDFQEGERSHGALPSPWIHSFKRGTNAEVDLIRPGLDRNSPFRGAETATDLLLALVIFRQLVGETFHHSASATSRSLLLGLSGSRLRIAPMPQPAKNVRTEESLDWCLPAEAVRQLPAYQYIHAYDKNAAYLGAACSLTVGTGLFTHVTDAADYSVSLPGYFQVIEEDGHQRWVTTPTLAYRLEQGPVAIQDAYVWTDHHQPLQPWYRVLRDARKALKLPSAELTEGARLMALSAVKGCYTSFLAGYLCSTSWDRSNDVLYRPDIRHMVIAKARCTLLRTIKRCQEDGATVLGASGIDTFYLLSSQRDPVLAKPMRLNLGTDQVCYKVKGTWEITPRLRDVLEMDINAAVKFGELAEGLKHERTR